MVEVKYKDYELTVKGHANYAEKGKDIICASVSTLACTLAQSGIELGDNGFLAMCDFKLDEGDVHIQMIPNQDCEALVMTVFKTILNGYEMLADSYPQYISYICE